MKETHDFKYSIETPRGTFRVTTLRTGDDEHPGLSVDFRPNGEKHMKPVVRIEDRPDGIVGQLYGGQDTPTATFPVTETLTNKRGG